jgi:predicted DNA-binding transcriptional regulator YafY
MTAKHDPDSNAAEKTLAIYILLLFKAHTFSLSDLAERLTCSKQTVIRLCTNLERMVPEFRTELRGKERWYWFEKPASRPTTSLAPESLKCLTLCKNLSSHLLPKDMLDEIDTALEKAAFLLTNLDLRDEALDLPVETRGKGYIDYTPHHNSLQKLLDAIKTKSICKVTYKKSFSSDEREHHFLPIKIIAQHESLYVDGWSVSDRGTVELRHELTFAVHRIIDVLLTRRSVNYNIITKENDHSKKFGIMSGDSVDVKVEFSKDVAQYICERTWSDNQNIKTLKDGRVILQFTSESYVEAIAWILSFGEQAKVLLPSDLVSDVKEIIKSLYKNYAIKALNE